MEYIVKIGLSEIYMEKIQDLLKVENVNLKIREDPKKGIYIEG